MLDYVTASKFKRCHTFEIFKVLATRVYCTKKMETSKKERSRNPRKGANVFSIATFSYTIPTFIRGFKKDLQEEDMPDILEKHKSSRLGDKLEVSWKKEIEKYPQPSLWRAILRVFGVELLFYWCGLFVSEIVLKTLIPIALSQLIIEYTQSDKEGARNDKAYVYAGMIISLSILYVIFGHHSIQGVQILILKIKIACCSLIYRKSLKLSYTALAESAAGQLTNLLSNDVSRFEVGLLLLHMLWICPLQLIITACILYTILGLTPITGILFLIAFSPLQVFLAKLSSKFRLKTALTTDQRLSLMNEIVTGIKVIKMYTWEKPFSNLIASIRRIEIGHIRATSYVRGILSSTTYASRIAIFLAILIHILTGNTPTAEYVYVITSFYNSLRTSVNTQFPKALADFAQLRISVRRLQKFLLLEEINYNDNIIPGLIISPHLTKNEFHGLDLQNVTGRWIESSSEDTLQNINLEVKMNQLIAIVGPVGSGKTSILQVILKELPVREGTVKVAQKIAYAAQVPWLFGGSIKQNILFGQNMDLQRYAQVVKACALEHDFALLPYGDQTLVGERGVILSGGQKARVSFARAVYTDADVYLLDDPLSAVDPHVARQLFDNCITGFLQNKRRILVTHQVQFLQNTDKILLVDNGKIVISGTYAEIIESGVDFAKYFKSSDNVDNQYTNGTVALDEDRVDGMPVQFKEQKYSGGITGGVYSAYLKAGGSKVRGFLVLFLFVIAAATGTAMEYFMAFWVNQEQLRASSDNNELFSTTTYMCIYVGLMVLLLVIGITAQLLLEGYLIDFQKIWAPWTK